MKIEDFRKLQQPKAHRHHREREHLLQVSCVRWYRLKHPKLRDNLFAVPNGGFRSATTAGKMKAEGVLAGVSDLILLKSNRFYGALLIEMKTADKDSRQTDRQREWQRSMEGEGYKYVVCRTLDEFIAEVEDYLSWV